MKLLIRLALIVLIVLALVSVYFAYQRNKSESVPFVYGLKTAPAKPVHYLPEAALDTLPLDPSAVAIYDAQTDRFTLHEILQTAGIPHRFIHDFSELNASKILFLRLSMDHPVDLNETQRKALYGFVKRGGWVVGIDILNTRKGALKALFGYRDFIPKRTRKELRLLSSPIFHYLDAPEERDYRLSSVHQGPWTNGIVPGTAKTVAVYEDNSSAITINRYGNGYAIAVGMSVFDLRLRNLFGKDYAANRYFINHLEPLSDLLVLLMKGVYRQAMGHGMFLHTAKNGNQASVILTHDVDFQDSIKNIRPYTQLEDELGVKATYNILTKYITDYKDKAFFTPQNLHFILDAQADGFEIGDHTVLHTKRFFFLPLGTCEERYPEYRPFSEGPFLDTGNPTVCGEVKVSKELLLGAGVKEVVSFRSGELLYNPHLPEALEKTGYRYSSCFSAEDVMSYFPYRYRYDYKTLLHPSKIWEIPLTYEDEHFPPLVFRTSKALELYRKVYRNGGVFNILDHNDMTWWKLKNFDPVFIRRFIHGLPKDTWITTMKGMGSFWDKRDRIVFRYRFAKGRLILHVSSPVALRGATFSLFGLTPLSDHAYPADIRFRGDKLIIDIPKGEHEWIVPLRVLHS
ncbi:hypothetical protein [Nitratifractor sp.]